MSDLHADSTHYSLPEVPECVDVIVIAGDIADGHERTLAWLNAQAAPTGLPILFVLGNHEIYGHDFHEDREDDYQKAGATLLHARRPSICVGNLRFVGSVLWTNFAIAGDIAASMSWFNNAMPDARDIDLGMRRLRARDVAAQHLVELSAIESALAEPFDGLTVVITHHGPHRQSLKNPDAPQVSDGSYVSDMTHLIERYRPRWWIHGHTHDFRRYQIGSTEIVCNPLGYSTGGGIFQSAMTIEV